MKINKFILAAGVIGVVVGWQEGQEPVNMSK